MSEREASLLIEVSCLRAEIGATREEARRLREALEELTGDYTGGAANALEDPYIMERALAALAEPAMTDPAEKWLEAGARAARAFMLGADVWDGMDDRKKRLCIDQWRTGLRAALAAAEKDGYVLVKVPEPLTRAQAGKRKIVSHGRDAYIHAYNDALRDTLASNAEPSP